MTTPLTPDDALHDRDALVAFLQSLRADHAANGTAWENPTLESFLAALEAWVSDAPGWYANHGQELPAGGDWTFMARALSAARLYE
ncbi:hypothetical protein OKJ48_38785 [Streptomyces kunmingensis]|uniref:DUF7660 domain-containing protein n=1 Tax=Streptomyces kunmingensis TaxID=68225 RepID=A0ABU6CN25_9ACTN|nr:hypothetical protein [Streptomyces kunmingensis]MEB3966129.1 hypothetical protein [Streptomyces kunmingensis]